MDVFKIKITEKKLDEIQKAIKEKQDMGTSMNEKDFMVQAGSSETIMENPEVKLQLEVVILYSHILYNKQNT